MTQCLSTLILNSSRDQNDLASFTPVIIDMRDFTNANDRGHMYHCATEKCGRIKTAITIFLPLKGNKSNRE